MISDADLERVIRRAQLIDEGQADASEEDGGTMLALAEEIRRLRRLAEQMLHG